MHNRLKTRVLTQPLELHSISAEWSDLCTRVSGTTPFQRPEWIITWVEIFAPAELRVIEVRSATKLVGLAPLLIYRRGNERVLAFAAGGVSDYLDLLVASDGEDENEILLAILDAMLLLPHWTTLDLTDTPSTSILNKTSLRSLATRHDRCSFISLPQTEGELLRLLSKRQRANLRNSSSRLKKAGGGHVEVATADVLPEVLDDLFRLHTTRWSQFGQSGVLAEEKIKTFHRVAAQGLLERGLLGLYRLRLEDHTIAVLYSILSEQTVFCYLQGFDPEFAHLSPGTLLMFFAMKDAARLGMHKFDLLRGDEEYKRHWRANPEHTYRFQIPRGNLHQFAAVHEIAA